MRANLLFVGLAVTVLTLTAVAVPAQAATTALFGNVVNGAIKSPFMYGALDLSAAVAPGSELTIETSDLVNGAIYIDVDGSGTVTSGDIRLRHATLKDGEVVRSSASDCCGGVALTVLGSATWAYVDLYPDVAPKGYDAGDGDGAYAIGEPVFIDIAGDGVVDADDYQIVGRGTAAPAVKSGAGTFKIVGAGNKDVGNPATPIAGYALNALDVDNSGTLTFRDLLYVDINADGRATPGDLRMNPIGNLKAGTQVAVGDYDAVHILSALASAAPAQDSNGDLFLDADGDGAISLGDMRYMKGGRAVLKAVAAKDADLGDAYVASTAVFAYRNRNGDGGLEPILGPKDDLYVSINALATVAVGDYQISGGDTLKGNVGTKAGDGRTGTTIIAFADGVDGTLSYLDVDGNGAYGEGDIPFVDLLTLPVALQGVVSPGDIPLGTGRAINTKGVPVKLDNSVTEPCFSFDFSAGIIRFIDEGNPAVVSANEGIVFDRDGAGVILSSNDIVFSPGQSGLGAPGTRVGGSAAGATMTTVPGGGLMLVGGGPPGVFTYGTQSVVLDSGTSVGLLDSGDVVLSGSSALITKPGARPQPPGLGQTLVATPGTEVFMGLDASGDGNFGAGDFLFLDMDGDGCATVGDIPLSTGK